MGKTMFGIPGVNEKSQSGSAIAPKGTPSGSAGAGKGASGGMSQPGQQKQPKPQEKAPMAKPVMARQMIAGGANINPKASTATPQKSTASKTMFGMPAMTMPRQNASQQPEQPSVQQDSEPASTPEKKDAYGATMMGVPSITNEIAQATVAENAEKTADQRAAAHQTASPASAKTMLQQAVAAPLSGQTVVQQAATDAPMSIAVAQGQASEGVVTESSAAELNAADAEEEAEASAIAAAPSSSPDVATSPPVVRSGEPSKKLVAGLIIGFFMMIGAMAFVAWKFLLS